MAIDELQNAIRWHTDTILDRLIDIDDNFARTPEVLGNDNSVPNSAYENIYTWNNDGWLAGWMLSAHNYTGAQAEMRLEIYKPGEYMEELQVWYMADGESLSDLITLNWMYEVPANYILRWWCNTNTNIDGWVACYGVD